MDTHTHIGTLYSMDCYFIWGTWEFLRFGKKCGRKSWCPAGFQVIHCAGTSEESILPPLFGRAHAAAKALDPRATESSNVERSGRQWAFHVSVRKETIDEFICLGDSTNKTFKFLTVQ